MKWYPWLNVPYLKILNAYKIQKGHHFLLIESKRDNGGDSLIYALNRWLMCSSPNGSKSCNRCHNCRLMQSGTHPDYYVMVPEGNVQNLGVEKIRILIEKLYQYSYISSLKIVYIKNSEWLTDESINALLKIFEEPPNEVYFFLGCKDFSRLLPTFSSRCLRWVLFPPEEKLSLSWLCSQGVESNIEAVVALRLSDGAPIEAYRMLRSDYWKLRLKLCKELRYSINNSTFFNLFSFFNKNESENKIFIFWICSFLLDALKYHYGVYDFLINIDQIDLIRCMFFKFSVLVLNNQIQQWLICLYHCGSNRYINQKLLLSYQLLNIENNVTNFTY